MPDLIVCGFCSGRGTVPNPIYDRDGRHRGPSVRTCEYCGGHRQVERTPAAERVLPCPPYRESD